MTLPPPMTSLGEGRDLECEQAPSPTSSNISASSLSSLSNNVIISCGSPSRQAVQMPFLQLLFAHIGAALTLFLATTDATIVSTSLPVIVADLKASPSQYPWVSIAYLLTQTAFQPLYGRFSDLFGRKVVLYTSFWTFMLGSLLCGLAPTFISLCIFRALAGIGAGGIVNCVWLITAEIVDERSRAKWSQALSATWSASAVAGPILGGVFSDENTGVISWRWAFFITLPIGAIAFPILFFSLRNVTFGSGVRVPWRMRWSRFDFIGLMSFMGGTACIILGLSLSSESDGGWLAPSVLVPLILGPALLVAGSVYEMHTTRDHLFPPVMFKIPAIGIVMVINFLHNFAFNAGTYYLALYYQAVDGSTPLQSGVNMLPYSLGSSLASMPAAWLITYWQRRMLGMKGIVLLLNVGLVISAIGFGFLISMDEYSSNAMRELPPLIAGLGIGMLFHAPFQALTSLLDPKDLAAATSAFFLIRFTGATCGLAVAGAVFESQLLQSGAAGKLLAQSGSGMTLQHISSIQSTELRQASLSAVAAALRSIWIVCTSCLGFAFSLSLLLLHRTPRSLN